jgi:hypothetical protein
MGRENYTYVHAPDIILIMITAENKQESPIQISSLNPTG